MITIKKAETPLDIDAIRDLIRAFVRWAMADIAKSDNPAVFAGLKKNWRGFRAATDRLRDAWYWRGAMENLRVALHFLTGAIL